MKRVGVREFRDNATKYLAGDEILRIERHGEPLGIYVPIDPNRRERLNNALDRLEKTVQRIMADTGLTEDELADLFDLSKPLPDAPIGRRSTRAEAGHAADR